MDNVDGVDEVDLVDGVNSPGSPMQAATNGSATRFAWPCGAGTFLSPKSFPR